MIEDAKKEAEMIYERLHDEIVNVLAAKIAMNKQYEYHTHEVGTITQNAGTGGEKFVLGIQMEGYEPTKQRSQMESFYTGYDWFWGAAKDGMVDGMCFYQWLSNGNIDCRACTEKSPGRSSGELCSIAQKTKYYPKELAFGDGRKAKK
jgi:hypothetical protein